MQNKRIKVVNISGSGRSGSTLLGNVLGQSDGFFFGGELRSIWKLLLTEESLCACGVPLRECSIWRGIFNKAFGGIEMVNAEMIAQTIQNTTRSKHMLHRLFKYKENNFNLLVSSYLKEIKKLFFSIQSFSNCKVIVDSSKSPLYGYILSLIEGLDVYIIHLIRDPRGVAYSRQKKKIQSYEKKIIYMRQYNSFNSSLTWNIINLLTESLRKRYHLNCLRVCYEDFANNPQKVLNRILDFIGEPSSSSSLVSEKIADLNANHSVWGNPARFQTGETEIKLDEEWKEKMNKTDILISSLVTFPLLLKYGYKLTT